MIKRRKSSTEFKREAVELTCRPQASMKPSGAEFRCHRLVFVGLVVVGTSLLLPETLFHVTACVFFGLAWGAGVVLLASILAAALQYGLAYRLLREPIRRRLGVGTIYVAIQHAVRDGDFRLQLLLRLAPLNLTIVSYLLGASGVRFSRFLVASVAMLPSIIVEVYLGHVGKHLALINTSAAHAGWPHDVVLFVGLLTVAIGVGFASRTAYSGVLRETNIRVGV